MSCSKKIIEELLQKKEKDVGLVCSIKKVSLRKLPMNKGMKVGRHKPKEWWKKRRGGKRERGAGRGREGEREGREKRREVWAKTWGPLIQDSGRTLVWLKCSE